VGIGAQKLDTIESHPARLREDAQQPDMIAAIPLRSFSMLQRRSNTPDQLRRRRSPNGEREAAASTPTLPERPPRGAVSCIRSLGRRTTLLVQPPRP
jgi:hypothetical protein